MMKRRSENGLPKHTLSAIKARCNRPAPEQPLVFRVGKLAACFAGALLVASCVNISVGSKPSVAALENQLKLGKSTRQEVLGVLGEPFGKGFEMLPFMDKPRLMYTYYYEEGGMADDRRLFLFVFLADGVYDGYMWFSSLPELQP